MRIQPMVIMALLAANAYPQHHADTARQRQIVWVNNSAVPPNVLQLAEATAARMFSDAGVEIEWHGNTLDDERLPGAIAIRLTPETPVSFLPGALAFSQPFQGVHITVFWDRIYKTPRPASTDLLLAHVLVHEITHILQGVDRHSDSGIMKAHWTNTDFTAMAWKPLPFTQQDILLIRLGLLERMSLLASTKSSGR